MSISWSTGTLLGLILISIWLDSSYLYMCAYTSAYVSVYPITYHSNTSPTQYQPSNVPMFKFLRSLPFLFHCSGFFHLARYFSNHQAIQISLVSSCLSTLLIFSSTTFPHSWQQRCSMNCPLQKTTHLSAQPRP